MSEEPVNLPSAFADLQALATKFAIADDEDRETAMEQASPEELKALLDSVSPKFEEINAYLDEHDDEDAHVLGRLAEAACEVVFELERRGNS